MIFAYDTNTDKIIIQFDSKDNLGEAAQKLAALNRGVLVNDIKNSILNLGLMDDNLYTKCKNFLEVFVAQDQKFIEEQHKANMMLSMIMDRDMERDPLEMDDDELDEPLIPPTQSFSPNDN
jgi:hypothetical protein